MTQTYSSAEEAVEAQRDAADRVLGEVLTVLGPLDLDQVRDTVRGDAAACTLDAPPALPLILRARVEVEGAVGAAEGARTTMQQQAGSRLRPPGRRPPPRRTAAATSW